MADRRGLRGLVASGNASEPRPSRALVAAATKVRIGDRASVAAVKRRELWQDECWDSFDAVGEVKYGSNYLGNALSRLGLYVGVNSHEADADPVPITDELPEGENVEPGDELVDSATLASCYDALERLASGHGGHGELLRELGVNLTIAGECYLYGRDESHTIAEEERTREVWDVRSVNEVVVSGEDRVRIIDAPDKTSTAKGGQELDPAREDVFLIRVWQRHPRWGGLADSPLRGVLGACEELLLTEQATRAIARSRMNAGMLLLPTEISFGPAQGSDDDSEDPFLDSLMEAMTTPIQDEGDASSVTPMVVRAGHEYLDSVRHLTFDRKLDDHVLERQRAALRRIAQGMNLPVEVITGLQDVNHWTAWQIEESTFKAHVEPLAIAIVNALTEGYLIPMLEASGVDEPERYCVWFDASRLIARPNIADAADSAHDRFTISDGAYRRARGFDDADAPAEEEMRARVARNAAKRSASVAGEISEGVDPATGEGGEPLPDTGPDGLGLRPSSSTTVDVGRGDSIVVPALVASGRVPANLGELLRDVDRDLRNRVEAAADASMRRALERAGAMLRSRSKKNRAAADAIESTPNEHVAATLGPTLVHSLGVEEVELLEGSFDALGDRFVRWCSAAADAALDLVPGMDDAERDTLTRQFDRYSRDAWEWMRAELVTAAEELLYDPEPKAPQVGEWDDVIVVPYTIVREAVARAGGVTDSPIVASIEGQIGAYALGVATGYLSSTTYEEHGVAREAWVWDYGPYRRTRGFEPHTWLDGAVFESFTDDVLSNIEGWPPGGYYLPGDHDGCRCDVSPVMVDQQGIATPEVDVYADLEGSDALDVGLLVPSPSAPPAQLRRHPAGGYTAVDEAGEGYYVRQLSTNEGQPGAWRIEEQYRDPDGVLMATRIGETRTLADARRIVGSKGVGSELAGVGVRDLMT